MFPRIQRNFLLFACCAAGIIDSDAADIVPEEILAKTWTYDGEGTGTDSWAALFRSCAGQFQSPIDIDSDAANYWGTAPFELRGYDETPTSMHVENNGLGVTLFPVVNPAPRMTGGDLKGEFQLVQIHWHWGSSSSRGSEHLFDGRSFPMEIHFVHFNTRYTDIEVALQGNDHDALAVLGFMYEISAKDNKNLDPLIASLEDLQRSEDGKVNLAPETLFPMSTLMDLDNSEPYNFNGEYTEFYRYEGSLTTPTCNEQVAWTVFKRTVKISERQMQAFRALTNEEGRSLNDNYRPVLPLGDRILRRYSTVGYDAAGPSLNTIDADHVQHDHAGGHEIFYDPSYYAQPAIRALISKGDAPGADADGKEIVSLRTQLEQCLASYNTRFAVNPSSSYGLPPPPPNGRWQGYKPPPPPKKSGANGTGRAPNANAARTVNKNGSRIGWVGRNGCRGRRCGQGRRRVTPASPGFKAPSKRREFSTDPTGNHHG